MPTNLEKRYITVDTLRHVPEMIKRREHWTYRIHSLSRRTYVHLARSAERKERSDLAQETMRNFIMQTKLDCLLRPEEYS